MEQSFYKCGPSLIPFYSLQRTHTTPIKQELSLISLKDWQPTCLNAYPDKFETGTKKYHERSKICSLLCVFWTKFTNQTFLKCSHRTWSLRGLRSHFTECFWVLCPCPITTPPVVVCLMPLVEREGNLYMPRTSFIRPSFAFVSYGHAAFMDVD